MLGLPRSAQGLQETDAEGGAAGSRGCRLVTGSGTCSAFSLPSLLITALCDGHLHYPLFFFFYEATMAQGG